jgi:hypothetical protein
MASKGFHRLDAKTPGAIAIAGGAEAGADNREQSFDSRPIVLKNSLFLKFP